MSSRAEIIPECGPYLRRNSKSQTPSFGFYGGRKLAGSLYCLSELMFAATGEVDCSAEIGLNSLAFVRVYSRLAKSAEQARRNP